MSIVRYVRSAAAASWIDARTGLPEVDVNAPGAFVQRGFLTGAAGFRFANFMEIWANYDTDTRAIVGHGFTADSGLYRSPSYGGIPSQVGTPIRSVKVGVEPITFIQTTGARTQSPEKIGGLFGPIGNIFASAVKSFPPIWTEIQIQLFGDGHSVASVRRWSLFPSMTFYTRSIAPDSTLESGAYSRTATRPGEANYDGMPNYDKWYANGWGDLGAGVSGPITGNPWGMDKTVLSGIDPSQPFGW
jgi:hypothetical protein